MSTEQQLVQYLGELKAQDKRTSRHASEEAYNTPELADTSMAQRAIRLRLHETFSSPDEVEKNTQAYRDLLDNYWSRASRVGVEHGAKEGYDLEDYMRIGESRSYPEIREIIRQNYPEQSLPIKVLDSIDTYSETLQINPSLAARITMELLSRRMSDVKARAEMIELSDEGVTHLEASTKALNEFLENDVQNHATEAKENYGVGDAEILRAYNKQSFYPANEIDVEGVDLKPLVISSTDAKGMIEAYDVQSRPYDADTLHRAGVVAARPEVQMMFIEFQERFIRMAERFFENHPDYIVKSPEIYSEVFVPENGENGETNLIPNPKLLRALVNNILPAIVISRETSGGDVDFDLDEADIKEGVHLASRTLKLFQTKIVQFNNFDRENDTVEVRSVYASVCPAGSMLPHALERDLPECYKDSVAKIAKSN